MFTRCPQCKTVYPLSAALISHAHGLVQCGLCSRTFSALSFLFDEWPAGQAYRPKTGTSNDPPLLGPVATIRSDTSAASENQAEDTGKTRSNRLAWGLATTLLVFLTVANLVWTFRQPLLETGVLNAWTNQAGQSQNMQGDLLKDPQQIQLVSRDIHTHPTRSGILVLSLTFVNLAQHSQVFPQLEVTLLDTTGQAIAQRRLQPADYLRSGVDLKAGLAPEVYLPVLLELGDPGKQAVGFEIRFL